MYIRVLQIEATVERRSLPMDMDPLGHLSDDEREVLKMVLQHYRMDQKCGRRWTMLLPSTGAMFASPIPVPGAGCDERPAQQVIVSDIRAQGQPKTPPPATRVPQLEHADEEEAEDDGPDGPSDGDTAMDEAILEVLRVTDKPLKRVTIAGRAGYAHSSHLLTRLRRLVEQKRVKIVGGCRYWLACRLPIPEA